MESLPHCTVEKMKDKYWNCGSPCHIHPVFGEKVYNDDKKLLIGSSSAPTPCKASSLRRKSLTSVVTSAGAATRGTALIIDTGTSARTTPAQDVELA